MVPAGDLPGHLSTGADEDQGRPQGDRGLQNRDACDVAEADQGGLMVHCGQGSGGDEGGSPRSESRTEIWSVTPQIIFRCHSHVTKNVVISE